MMIIILQQLKTIISMNIAHIECCQHIVSIANIEFRSKLDANLLIAMIEPTTFDRKHKKSKTDQNSLRKI